MRKSGGEVIDSTELCKSRNSSYLNADSIKAYKNDNVITIWWGSRSKAIPSKSWANLGTLKEKYRPKINLTFPGVNTVDGGSVCISSISTSGVLGAYGGASSSSTYEATITYVI